MSSKYKEYKAQNSDCRQFGGTKKWVPLSLNDTGENVRLVQEGLVTELLMAPSEVDGHYGPRTEMAVRAFQSLNDLLVDGIVGKETRKKLLGL